MTKRTSEDFASSCAFTFSDGRRCRMLRSSRKSKYCVYHQRKLMHIEEAGEAAIDLYKPICGAFVHHAALAQSLARLYAFVADGRINAKDAVAMSRIAETLLKAISLSMTDFRDTHTARYWAQLVHKSFGSLPAYVPPPPGENGSSSELPKTAAEFAQKVLSRLQTCDPQS